MTYELVKDTPKESIQDLSRDVAKMLLDFKQYVNRDHGDYLLLEWDNIREKYEV